MNRLLNYKSASTVTINAKTIQTEILKLKIGSSFVDFKIPNLGAQYQVLSTSGGGDFNWVDNNSNITTVYYCNLDKQLLFNDEINLSNNMDILRSGNFILDDFTNKKILLKLGFIYRWYDNSVPQDYYVRVLVNDIEEYTNREGLSDYTGIWNKLSDEIILDVLKTDVIKIILTKTVGESNSFEMKKNSFYSIELL